MSMRYGTPCSSMLLRGHPQYSSFIATVGYRPNPPNARNLLLCSNTYVGGNKPNNPNNFNNSNNPNKANITPPSRQSRFPSLNPITFSGKPTNVTTCAASSADMPLESRVSSASFFFSERAKVAIMVAFAMALCNVDRVVMSVSVLPLAAANNWSSSISGVVQSSFLWGYLLSPVAGGALADHYGGKRVFAWGVALWSLATLLTPWAASHSLGMLLAMRSFMGLAEGVAIPSMNIMMSRWFPRTERSTALAITMGGFHLGSVTGLVVTPLILAQSGIAGPFTAFGLLGFLWLLCWIPFITSSPDTCKHISGSELSYIQEGLIKLKTQSGVKMPPFKLFFSKLPIWAIIVANSMNSWGYFILLSWMPTYFNTVFGVNLKQASWFSALPWAMMAGVGCLAGSISDYLIKSGLSVTTVRKIIQTIGFLVPAVSLLCLNSAPNANVAAVLLTTAVSFSSFSQAGFLVNIQDVAPRYTGVLNGISNTAATLAGIISTVGTGAFVERLGSFQAFLTLTSFMYLASIVFWNVFATGEKIID